MARTGIPTGDGRVIDPRDRSKKSSGVDVDVDLRDLGGDPAGDADRDTDDSPDNAKDPGDVDVDEIKQEVKEESTSQAKTPGDVDTDRIKEEMKEPAGGEFHDELGGDPAGTVSQAKTPGDVDVDQIVEDNITAAERAEELGVDLEQRGGGRAADVTSQDAERIQRRAAAGPVSRPAGGFEAVGGGGSSPSGAQIEEAKTNVERQLERQVGASRAERAGIVNPTLREEVVRSTDLEEGEDFEFVVTGDRVSGRLTESFVERQQQEAAEQNLERAVFEETGERVDLGPDDFDIRDGTVELTESGEEKVSEAATREQFGDADALMGPNAEEALKGFSRRHQARVGRQEAGTSRALQRLGVDSARAEFVSGVTNAPFRLIDPAGHLVAAEEGAELVQHSIGEVRAGRSEELREDLGEAYEGAVRSFAEDLHRNPARTVGTTLGSVALTAGGTAAVARASPRAARAAAVTFQPGEEIASAAVTRAAPGVARRFPGGRVDWEEPVVAGAGEVGRATGRGVRRAGSAAKERLPDVETVKNVGAEKARGVRRDIHRMRHPRPPKQEVEPITESELEEHDVVIIQESELTRESEAMDVQESELEDSPDDPSGGMRVGGSFDAEIEHRTDSGVVIEKVRFEQESEQETMTDLETMVEVEQETEPTVETGFEQESEVTQPELEIATELSRFDQVVGQDPKVTTDVTQEFDVEVEQEMEQEFEKEQEVEVEFELEHETETEAEAFDFDFPGSKKKQKTEAGGLVFDLSGSSEKTPGFLTETFLGFGGIDVAGREVVGGGELGEFGVELTESEESRFEDVLRGFGL